MKNLFFVVIFFSALLILSAQTKGPRMLCSLPDADLGTAREGEVLRHDFVICNMGDDLLVIRKVWASCGCTAAVIEKNELQPRETTTIHIEFNTRGRSGLQKKFIEVFSNDTTETSYRLNFKARIMKPSEAGQVPGKKNEPSLKLDEIKHDFGRVTEGTVLPLELKYKNTGTKELVITEVKTSCGCTVAELSTKKLQPKEEGTLKLKFDTKGRAGIVSRTVTIFSNDPESPATTLTLTVNILDKGK